MHDLQQKIIIKLASKFIKPEVIQISYSNIFEINISRHSQKEDEDLSVGLLTDALLKHLLDEGSITDHQVNKFYSGVRAFFTTAFKYCCDWLQIKSDLLKYCTFVDFTKRKEIPFQYVERCIPYFKRIHEVVSKDQTLL